MIYRGIATFGLDTGACPRWLFERMVKLGREIVRIIVEEYTADEFVARIGNPVWFQSLGTVLAFDWNASGLTTILTAALKEAIRGNEKNFGIYICGGKGATSRKTPEEIKKWGEILSLPPGHTENLVYNSKMSAKVDNALVQDGFQIYHHAFFFTVKKNQIGSWTVVQQGMNTLKATARRYHWHSAKITDLVCEPHSGIVSAIKTPTLDLTSKKSSDNRQVSTQLAQNSFEELMKDIKIIRKHSSSLSKTIALQSPKGQLTLLNLENKEFKYHPVVEEDFNRSRYLEKILWNVCQQKPKNYEKLLAAEGVGPKTIRALSLVAEVIYGAKPSYEDPARYSFAHGGKDRTPYPVDRQTYDQSIEFFRKVVPKMKVSESEKRKMLGRLGLHISRG